MADLLRDHPDLRPFVLPNVNLTGIGIGAGAYGSVDEVKIPGAVCAAKRIHDVFQDCSKIPAAEIQRAAVQFVEECQLMSALRHPHIVQFLGVCFLPDACLPALVMERLLTSLHALLDVEPAPQTVKQKPFFPLGLKCSIIHDVANGLAYLHERSPPIIHRNLSARNVLLNSAMVAKIADLGVARIVPQITAAASPTKAPGTFIYMPPEVTASAAPNKERSKYSSSIDIFSLGIVSIFTLGQTFPCDLLEPTYMDKQSGLLKARTELERRSEYMQQIYPLLRQGHPLIQMIQQCLQNVPARRPSIREVLQLLEQARAELGNEEYDMNKLELIQALQNHPRNEGVDQILQSRVRELQQQLQSCETEKQAITQWLIRTEAELASAQDIIRRKQQQEHFNRREIGELEQRLQSSEALVADFQQVIQLKESEIEELRAKVTINDERVDEEIHKPSVPTPKPRTLASPYSTQQLSAPDIQHQGTGRRAEMKRALSPSNSGTGRPDIGAVVPQSNPVPINTGKAVDKTVGRRLTVQCFTQKPLEYTGISRGSAAIERNFAYFTPYNGHAVFQYNVINGKWTELPKSPHSNMGLVVIDGALVAIGGENKSVCSNKLFSLRNDQWIEEYPPMNTAHSCAAVVSIHCSFVIVIGGNSDDGLTSTVELLNMTSRCWHQLTHLPQPPILPSATICGNSLHVIGRTGDGYSCSLQTLLSGYESESLPCTLKWISLPHLPVKDAAAATLRGQLVIVGGRQDSTAVSSIYQLVGRQWVEIGSMRTPRRECLVVSPSPEKVIIVGGVGTWRSVELCHSE